MIFKLKTVCTEMVTELPNITSKIANDLLAHNVKTEGHEKPSSYLYFSNIILCLQEYFCSLMCPSNDQKYIVFHLQNHG